MNCDKKCSDFNFQCGNGHCVDRNQYINSTLYKNSKIYYDTVYVGYGFFDTNDGYVALVSCECNKDWSGRRCNIYTADWIRIIKTMFNWAIFTLLFIIIWLLQPLISKYNN